MVSRIEKTIFEIRMTVDKKNNGSPCELNSKGLSSTTVLVFRPMELWLIDTHISFIYQNNAPLEHIGSNRQMQQTYFLDLFFK